MREAIFTVALLNFASYFWSVFGIFRSHSETQSWGYRGLQLNSVLLWIHGLYLVYSNEVFDGKHLLILIIQVNCLVGFWSTSSIARKNKFTIAFSNDIPEKLVQYGLYRYVRHPFYTIYMICYASLGFVQFSEAYFLLLMSMMTIYFFAAKKEEEKFLSTDTLCGSYKSYRQRTGMFFPKLFRK